MAAEIKGCREAPQLQTRHNKRQLQSSTVLYIDAVKGGCGKYNSQRATKRDRKTQGKRAAGKLGAVT